MPIHSTTHTPTRTLLAQFTIPSQLIHFTCVGKLQVTCQHCTKDIRNNISSNRYSFFTTWNGRPHSPHRKNSRFVSAQMGEGGRTTPYTYTMTAAELNSKVTQQKFSVAEIALLMHCTSGAGT